MKNRILLLVGCDLEDKVDTGDIDTWSALPDLPSSHGNNGTCTVSEDGFLYVGTGSNKNLYRIDLY